MTLDEAIKHAEEVADKKEREKQKWEKFLETDSDYRAVAEKVSCELCAEEHRQLAEWLKDYKRLLEQQPCEDCVSRDAVLDLVADYDLSMGQVVKGIHALPPVTPQPKMARWIPDICNMYICQNCSNTYTDLSGERYGMNFCPNCGRKMQEVEKI